MATTVPLTGAGATITGTGFTSFVTSIKIGTTSVEQLEWSDLSTTDYKQLRPSDLKNAPEVTLKCFYIGGAPPVGTTMTQAIGTIYAGVTCLVTLPTLTGGSLTGTGFVKSWDGPEAKQGELMEGTIVFQYDGVTGPTWA